MLIRKAKSADLETVYNLVQNTIKAVYGNFYTKDEVDFFLQWHSKEVVEKDIKAENVYVLTDGRRIFATCAVDKNEINRFFVDKDCLRMGYGSLMIDKIEKMILKKYEQCILATSIPAKEFYTHRGYNVVTKEKIEIKTGKYMQYEVMEKTNRSAI